MSSDADVDPMSHRYQLASRYQPRRMYQTPDARDPHDRTYSRSSRNVVVVIPPPDLPLDRGPLGNVLSVGPRHRLSQGILMPLFPSMLGQLNAIAHEYNFPSTAGLCLYLHINENGIARTPRISDDSWQYLFGHLFDGRPYAGGQRLPIGGSLEFDIDLSRARWFDAWVSGSLRDSNITLQPVVTPTAPFEPRWRGESQTTKVDGQQADDRDRWNASGSHTMVTNSRPEALRHLPKKLSLVDRLDSHSLHVPSKSPNYPDLAASSPTHGTYASSPILQSATPRPTESDLECRVNSWRETTELFSPSMAETQPASDVGVPAGLTVMDECALERTNFRQATRIDDFLWAATSVPRNPTPSMHLDSRTNGAVPLTLTTMTSSRPVDDDQHSVLSSVSWLPSPDTGERVVEDIMAPRSRAVWGNSFGWSSETTWKQVYPFAPLQAKPKIRVYLQDPLPHYPNLVIYPSVASQTDPRPSVWGSSFGWQRSVTWRKVYPYSATVQSLAVQLRTARGLEPKYPSLCIYPAAYPRFETHPPCTVEGGLSQPISVSFKRLGHLSASYPSLVIYPAVWPHLDIYPPMVDLPTEGSDPNACSLSNACLYPNLVLYPAVYPHFDLYPKTLQISDTLRPKEVEARLVNVGRLTSQYPNMTIYPDAHPYPEIYPMRNMRQTPGSTWGISFGWMAAKTWLQVYPLHTVSPLTTAPHVDDRRRFISRSRSDGAGTGERLLSSMSSLSSIFFPVVPRHCGAADTVVSKRAVWGSSFGWKSATTWRAVWPASPAQSSMSVQLEGQSDSSSGYPYLVIYPATYPHLDIYPSLAAVAQTEVSQLTMMNQATTDPVPHYPNLVLYRAAYPHFDLYPAFATAPAVEKGKGESNLHRRRIEMRRVKTAAQVGLPELIANNHVWEAREPLRVDLADYARSPTFAGPCTLAEFLDIASVSRSVHIDCRVQGSVLRTPSTATTWGPQDGNWYSEVDSVERLPSPDLGQRFIENTELPIEPWHMVWPFFRALNHVEALPTIPEQSIFVSEYPHLVIYSLAYPYFELYPTRENVSTPENGVAVAYPIVYPAFDIYPAVYPHFDIYPVIGLQIENPSNIVFNVWHERIEVKLASVYPNFDIYSACYPYNLDYVYPCINPTESTPIEAFRCYPCLAIYSPLYPLVVPHSDFSSEPLEPQFPPSSLPPMEWKSVCVKLSVQYPLLDLYPAGYPWSLDSIYPTISVDNCPGVVMPEYPCIWIYPPVYPFVQPYPTVSDSVPGALDEGEYEFARASLALSELEPIILGSVVYPYFDLYPAAPVLAPQPARDVHVGDVATILPQMPTIARMERKTHMELRAAVFRSLGKQPARVSKTHLQLHTEVFPDAVVRSPRGDMQGLSPSVTKKLPIIPAPEPRRQIQVTFTPHPLHSRSGITTASSPDRVHFPLTQPPALPPLRIRNTVPSQPAPAVSESPMPRLPSPTSPYTHVRTSARFTQAVRSMMPGGPRRSASVSLSAPLEDHKERVKSPTRLLSFIDRRAAASPPPPHTEILARAPRSAQSDESFALQRARAYEQTIVANRPSGTAGTTEAYSPFMLPPLPQMPSMTGVAEAIDRKTKAALT